MQLFCQERREDPRRGLEFPLKTTGERAGGGVPGKIGFPLSAPARQRLKGGKGSEIFDLEESVYGSRSLGILISPAPSKERFSAVIFTRLKKKTSRREPSPSSSHETAFPGMVFEPCT